MVLIVLVAGTIAYLMLKPSAVVELPNRIGSLQQVRLLEGEKADAILNQMHDKDVTPETNKIGMYSGAEGGAVVYLSVYNSDDDANAAFAQMTRSIEHGNLLFTGYRKVRFGKIDASFCVGQGQDHYFFVSGDRLYWLAADNVIAEKVVNELVGGL